MSPSLFFFFQDYFGDPGSYVVPSEFYDYFSSPVNMSWAYFCCYLLFIISIVYCRRVLMRCNSLVHVQMMAYLCDTEINSN